MEAVAYVSSCYVFGVEFFFTVDSGLSENAVYSFRVLVANAVGVASTNYTTFCESYIHV